MRPAAESPTAKTAPAKFVGRLRHRQGRPPTAASRMTQFVQMFADGSAATAAEYALILAVVGAAIAIAAISLGGSITGAMNTTSSTIKSCGGSC